MPTIIFLHGWGGSQKSFAQLIKHFKAQPHTSSWDFVAFDLPGFGEEPAPNSGWTTDDYAAWLDQKLSQEKLDPIKDKISFYGHSFGCRVILRWLLRHPEYQRKVILTGAAGIKWPPSLKQRILKFVSGCLRRLWPKNEKRESRIEKESKNENLETKPSRFPSFFSRFLPVFRFPIVVSKKLRRKLLSFLGAHDWAQIDPALKPTFQKVLAEEDLRIHLSKIQNQVLLLWGKNDTYTPLRSAHVFRDTLPQSELIVFPDGRHGIHYSHAGEIARLVGNFLSS